MPTPNNDKDTKNTKKGAPLPDAARSLADYARRARQRLGYPDRATKPVAPRRGAPAARLVLAFLCCCGALVAILLGSQGGRPWWPFPTRPGSQQLVVSFLDIGQGDSALVQTPGGKNVLIDTGPPGGKDELFAALSQRGVNRLDLLVTSHPHLDHFGNTVEVLRRIPTTAIVDSGFVTGSRTQERLLEEVKRQRVPFVNVARQQLAGTSVSLGDGVSLRYLAPKLPQLLGTNSDPNNNSIVLKITLGRVSFLFTGDMEEDERDRLLASTSAQDLQATVLKVAHHGSRNGTDAAFLSRVRPEAAVISCGATNTYGHPHPAVLGALQSANVRVFRTDQQGTITVETNGRTWTLR